jgi:hypothetical protein
VRLRCKPRPMLAATFVVFVAMVVVPTASATQTQVYVWQTNLAPNVAARDWAGPHNHVYNELFFGYGAGWRSEVWEVTPAGYRHFDKWCVGNCFNSHPAYYYATAFCANRDSGPHFVNDCLSRW